jgi:drug/metabolite transporter (DMT)-like permease
MLLKIKRYHLVQSEAMQGISMPYLLLTLAALFWGGNYVVGHILVQGADPILMTEARWALTALLLVVLYHRQIRESQQLFRQNALRC